MKVFELERLLAQITDKEQELMVGLTLQNGEYQEGQVTSVDSKGVVGYVYMEADEI